MGTLEASGAEPRWSRAKSFLSAALGTKIHLCTKFQVSTFYGFLWAVLSQSVTTSPFIYIDIDFYYGMLVESLRLFTTLTVKFTLWHNVKQLFDQGHNFAC